MEHMQNTEIVTIAHQIKQDLVKEYGYLVGGAALWRCLGYPSSAAFKRAQERQAITDLAILRIPRRRGVFCLAEDLAMYLARARVQHKSG